MPRQKKVVTTTIEEPGSPVVEELQFGEVAENDVPADLQNFLTEIGEDATRVVLFRQAKDGKSPYVGAYAAADFDMEMVKQEYGGGRYFCRVYGPTGVKKTYRFTIDESIKPVPPELRNTPPRDALIERLIERGLTGSDSGSKNPMEIAAEFAKASATQTQATIQLIMPLIEKMMGGGKSSNIGEMLQIMEFGIDHFGGGHEDGGMLAMAREVGLPLVDILKNQLGAPGKPTRPASTPPASTAAGPAWGNIVKKHVAALLPYIQQNADPGLVAAAMETQIPKFVRWLDAQVLDVNFRPQLFALCPELGPYAAWVDRFLEEFGPEDDGDDAPAAGNGVTAQPAEPVGEDEPVQ